IDVSFELDPLRRHLERPCTNHGDRKTDDREQDDQPDDPVWNAEKRKALRRDLDEQPRHYDVGDRDAVNTAPFEFCEKRARIHGRDNRNQCADPGDYFGPEELASFWKRGSFRSESNIGSSWRSAGVIGMPVAKPPLPGRESIPSKTVIARLGSPTRVATRARISSVCIPFAASFSIGLRAIARSTNAMAAALLT